MTIRRSTDAAPAPVRLSGAVMTHPSRSSAARRLAELDPAGRVQVVTDPEPDGPPTALRSAALAWQSVGPEATHHLVLQDDVVLAEGFYPYAERVAAAVRHEAVAFYAGWEGRTGAAVRLAALAGREWTYAVEEHTPCLALMLPAEVARGYPAFAAEHGNGWPYDVVMQRYLNSLGVPIRVSVPGTVDHSEVPSIAGNSTHGWRQAAVFTSRAAEPAAYDCAQFAVVPFYQYGDARTAIRRRAQEQWAYIETERYLRRLGLAEHCRTALAAADTAKLPGQVAQGVWETAFAMGVVVARVSGEAPAVKTLRTVMDSLGPGGLCEDYTAEELRELIPPIRDLAMTAFGEGHRAEPAGAPPAQGPRLAVTGGDGGFGRQLAGLLGDFGYRSTHVPAPVDAGQLDDTACMVHLGDPTSGAGPLSEVLSAAQKASVVRFVHVSSAAVYRGEDDDHLVTESSVSEPPADPEAAAWWQQEEQCRRWGAENGVVVQVLRSAEVVGAGVLTEGAAARSMLRAWTRRPLPLDRSRRHQVLDHRDLAGAVHAVLSAAPRQPVLNVASEVYGEEELAELVALLARRTPWEETPGSGVRQGIMATGLIESELEWRPSAPVVGGLRALAQWLACDIHDPVTGLPQTGGDPVIGLPQTGGDPLAGLLQNGSDV
ncbi:NAD-dependent epimerase/dehydratase family protein [Streptomyces sp. NPDC004629]|uniref:NAD-dependent epimerase/dehydratase family protein n=1 Tax=Streptomyces sp. NPDC004629 TaxID=3364705 RepID=UPI00368A71F5